MAAMWMKGSRMAVGFNRVLRKASTLSGLYRELCGVHCELDLCRRADLWGGTVYVAGMLRSGNPMRNTRPCDVCMEILWGVNHVVFFEAGKVRKEKVSVV